MADRISIPIVGGAYSGRSTNINAQVCQNLYPVLDNEGGKVSALMNTPGLKLWSPAAKVGEVRCVHADYQFVTGTKTLFLYAVIANEVHRYNSSGTWLNQPSGGWASTTGKVWTAGGYPSLGFLIGNDLYLWDTTSFDKVTDADFPVATSLAYQDGYFIVSVKDSLNFYISALNDGTSWDALDYAAKEAYRDNLQAVVSSGRELWLIGESSYEVWYNSGNATFPFERISGAVNNIGCFHRNTIAQHQGTIFFLDNHLRVRMSEGYNLAVVSTPQIEYQMASPSTDYRAYCYEQEGHVFYVLSLLSATAVSETWVYDVTTKLWHSRTGADGNRHRSNCHAYFSGKQIVGDFANGVLYSLDLATYTDYDPLAQSVSGALALGGSVTHA